MLTPACSRRMRERAPGPSVRICKTNQQPSTAPHHQLGHAARQREAHCVATIHHSMRFRLTVVGFGGCPSAVSFGVSHSAFFPSMRKVSISFALNGTKASITCLSVRCAAGGNSARGESDVTRSCAWGLAVQASRQFFSSTISIYSLNIQRE